MAAAREADICKSAGLKGRTFKSLWPHMLVTFTSEFQHVLRLVVIMLLIPLDDSEAERIFSLMNDIKTTDHRALADALGDEHPVVTDGSLCPSSCVRPPGADLPPVTMRHGPLWRYDGTGC